jgi:hypothetical protein
MNVTLKTEGTMDTYGFLFDSSGTELTRDDDSNGNAQFRIQATLNPGTYYVAVESWGHNSTGSYRLVLEGVNAARPSMSVIGYGNTIADGKTTTSSSDGTLFSTVTTRNTGYQNQFTIRNVGNAALALNGSPLVSITGAGASQFSVAVLPASSIAASGSTTFAVNYIPTAPGTHDATISINSNDTATSPYTFAVRGVANFPVDDHGNTNATATVVSLPSTTAGFINSGTDVDCFRFTLPAAGRVTIRTYGSIDTVGYLMNSAGNVIAFADDNDTDLNFIIGAKLPAGTYYVRVEGYNNTVTGSYSLRIQ